MFLEGRLFQFHSFGSDKQKAEVYKKIHGFNNDDSLYNWIETNMKGLWEQNMTAFGIF